MQKLKETQKSWSSYYKNKKHKQRYPDENLVRMIQNKAQGAALDLGCGRGRHLSLLRDFGFDPIYATDISKEALEESSKNFPFTQPLEFKFPKELEGLGENSKPSSMKDIPPILSLADSSLQLLLAWGVLHYNPSQVTEAILQEIKRLLCPGGFFLGTLRADRDTHLKTNEDLKGCSYKLYSEEECCNLLKKYFTKVELGYMERSPLGSLDQRICHWFFRAS